MVSLFVAHIYITSLWADVNLHKWKAHKVPKPVWTSKSVWTLWQIETIFTRSALFWDLTQHRLVILDRRFRSTFQSHLLLGLLDP